jgi:cytochrome c oxidase assembly protein subunit 19
MSAFGGARGLAAKAPEKGVFPLDHFGECKTVMKDYVACLKKQKGDSLECKNLSKRYLECRMDKNLMAKEDLSKLGFAEKQAKRPKAEPGAGQGRKKAQEGFVSGTRSSRQ